MAALLSPRRIDQSLSDDIAAANLVERILTLGEDAAKGLIGGTTRAGFRRVHEVVGAAIDRVIELERVKDRQSVVADLILRISSAMVLVKWQVARDQLSNDLGNALLTMLRGIRDDLVNNRFDDAIKRAQRARRIIDSLAVLVYEYTKKRERERE